MTCKNCNNELPEFGKFCPYCGTAVEEEAAPETTEEVACEAAVEETCEQAEETCEQTEAICEAAELEEAPAQKRKLKTWQMALLIVCGVVLLAAVAYGVLRLAGIDLKPKANDIYRKESYTVAEDELVKHSRDVVATMGSKELTVGELQMHYQSAFYAFYSENYYFMSYLGLDMTQPLDAQTIPAVSEDTPAMTWQQYFLEAALDNWKSYVVLELIAEEENFVINEQLAEVLNNMDANAQEMAAAYGYATVEEWLLGEIGAGVTLADYTRYNDAYYTGSDYLNQYYQKNVPTQAEIEAYYAENEAVFIQNGITKDLGLNASVRHILIQPTGGTTDENGATTYSEEEWAAAYTEAQGILEQWKAGEATEESFTELANTHSDDPGVVTNSGLYEDINVDASYLTEFKEWTIDANRKPGDTDIVKTSAGYHIMYFIEGEEYWKELVSEQVLADKIKVLLQENLEKYPIEVNYKNILVGEMKMG